LEGINFGRVFAHIGRGGNCSGKSSFPGAKTLHARSLFIGRSSFSQGNQVFPGPLRADLKARG